MAERRRFPRTKKRILLTFEAAGRATEGFTHDLSANGIFVRSAHFPRPGTRLKMRLKLPVGPPIHLCGIVVRVYRVPAKLAPFVPGGFSVRLVQPPEDYFQLLAKLLRVAA